MIDYEEKERRGRAASVVLENDTFRDAISATRARYINTMIDAIDDEGLRQAKKRLVVLNEVVGHLTEMAEDGRRAAEELKRLRDRQ